MLGRCCDWPVDRPIHLPRRTGRIRYDANRGNKSLARSNRVFSFFVLDPILAVPLPHHASRIASYNESFLRNWNASRSISNPSYSVNIVGRASKVAAELFPTEPFRRKLPRRNRLTRITARQSTQEKLWFARIRQSVTQPGSLEPAVDSAPAARGCRFDAGKSAAQEHLVS